MPSLLYTAIFGVFACGLKANVVALARAPNKCHLFTHREGPCSAHASKLAGSGLKWAEYQA